jgi:flagellar biosynthetic protein FliR
MTVSLALLPELAASFILIFARLGTLVMLLPGMGEQFFPARLRLTFALALTLVMTPLLQPVLGTLPRDIGPLLLLLGAEVLTGLFIGLCIRFVSGTLATAGTLIAQQIGLGFVTQIDPTQGGQSVLLANFMVLFGLVVIFTLDLHHIAIAAIHDSYRMFQPGATLPMGDFAQAALMIFAGSFALAVQISAPFLVFGLVFQLALGVLSRLMPQLQILFLAVPLQVLIGFALLGALLATIASWYGTHVAEVIGRFVER